MTQRDSTRPECEEHVVGPAPSEFLAEFLSAIMSGQYAEALKYCRLILQYEPENTTARGFRPLLELRLLQAEADRMEEDDDDASDATSGSAITAPTATDSGPGTGSGSADSDSDDNGNPVPRALCAI